jgi:hypothetical protein
MKWSDLDQIVFVRFVINMRYFELSKNSIVKVVPKSGNLKDVDTLFSIFEPLKFIISLLKKCEKRSDSDHFFNFSPNTFCFLSYLKTQWGLSFPKVELYTVYERETSL